MYIDNMKKQVIITSVLVAVAIVWLTLPIFLKKYIVHQAREHRINLQIEKIKLSPGVVKLFGVKASKQNDEAELKLVVIELDSKFKPKAIKIDGGTVNVHRQNFKGNNRKQLKLNIRASNLTVTSDICGQTTAQNVSLTRINGQISAQASEVRGNCYGFVGSAKRIDFLDDALKIQNLDIAYRKSAPNSSSVLNNTHMGNYGIKSVQINKLHVDIINTSIETSVTLYQNKDVYDAKLKSTVITSNSLESSITIQTSNLIIEKINTNKIDFGARFGKISMKETTLSKNPLDTKAINTYGAIESNNYSKHLDLSLLSNGVTVMIGIDKNKESTQLQAELLETSCDKLVGSIPNGMIDKISDFKFDGKISAKFNVNISSAKPKVKISLSNRCRVLKAPISMNVSNFRKIFTRVVQNADNKPVEIESGPGSKWWVPLNSIPRYMPLAVMTTEDAGFDRHNGFLIQAIENSIIMDIESGKFVRGGSTMSMQVSKNLWLSRTKTISRKLQEFFLTTYLEQSMSKNEIMELYLNIVELGPGIYGIGQASNEYFNKSAASLTLGECLFLASILPAPKQPKFNNDGLLYKQWASYLQTLMKLMAVKNYISEDELNMGLAEQIRKGGLDLSSKPPIQRDIEVNSNSWVAN